MDLSKLKICIFDVNGVLIDSNRANALAMGRAFTDDPQIQEQIATLYLTLTGIDRGEKIRRIQEQIPAAICGKRVRAALGKVEGPDTKVHEHRPPGRALQKKS